MNFIDDALFCVYCEKPIRPDDDSQFVEKGKPAHTACAFAVDAWFWAAFDAHGSGDVEELGATDA